MNFNWMIWSVVGPANSCTESCCTRGLIMKKKKDPKIKLVFWCWNICSGDTVDSLPAGGQLRVGGGNAHLCAPLSQPGCKLTIMRASCLVNLKFWVLVHSCPYQLMCRWSVIAVWMRECLNPCPKPCSERSTFPQHCSCEISLPRVQKVKRKFV